MDASASLRQTVTHLFDAVRYSNHARELEEAASKSEGELEAELSRLESHTEELTNLLASMEKGTEDEVRDLSRQVVEFLSTAKAQATAKLKRKVKDEVEEFRVSVATERDKAVKSLEAFLAADPLPIIETVVQVRLNEGSYEARSGYECEGGMKYEFRLATQSSRLFRQELSLSQLGYELRVPVRLSKALLKKARVPGFERLDQYVLTSAETSAGKIRAGFQKLGNDAKIKIVTSGMDEDGFIGIEYADAAEEVNVMNDPSLNAHVDLELVRKATVELIGGLVDLSKKKVALLKLSLNGEQSTANPDCEGILRMVLKVMGPAYKALVENIAKTPKAAEGDLSIEFIRERLKVLGGLSTSAASSLGLQSAAA